jgi:hypothetical protein
MKRRVKVIMGLVGYYPVLISQAGEPKIDWLDADAGNRISAIIEYDDGKRPKKEKVRK